ncbi:MAG: DMT family transporter [Mastigocoleus sp. MO_167.B18]|uniref:DMT family transporter n=1 Tax=Mastigocoleus sp. MO_188.B34 TaxID=3036635 RepID=UPI00260DBFC2|nr:DMT family transporter [Mastigocoleus sp. MO_188.B34]MDJ0694336.1 DMT family transporter [Mastigocoleus sp. MO_188.B34]MDJ0774824.1 DMT family transporter [Mastigocoleus sp. MO_167.B18]
MLIYGAIIVGFGQTFWFKGLKKFSSSMIAIAGAFNPIAAIFAAYVILREIPTPAQLIGGTIILFGIILSYFGNWSQSLNTVTVNQNIQRLHPQKLTIHNPKSF